MLTGTKENRKIKLLNKNAYTWAGLGLLIAGVLISLIAYFILALVWLTALGICLLILSFVLLTLGRTIPKLPPEVCRLLLETGLDNMATIVEELGIRSKAIYLPSSLTGGRPQALIPLHSNSSPPSLSQSIPRRLIVRYGSGPEDIGLLLSTIGTTAFTLLETKPGSTSSELESALTWLFTGILDVADKTRVKQENNHIKVEIDNHRLENQANWSHQCLGGPLASVVASVTAEAWNKPVMITQEKAHKGKYTIELELAP